MNKWNLKSRLIVSIGQSLMLLSLSALTACEGGLDANAAVDPAVLGVDHVNGRSANLPFVDDDMSRDPNHLTIALRFVNYVSDDGKPVITADQTKQLVHEMNQLYATCNLHVRVDDYQEIRPGDVGLKYNPSSMGELNPIRAKFDDERYLVIVNTGSWNSAGGLGADGANAWTTMPGSSPSGAVIEKDVAMTSALVAHELGHYLNLDHAGSSSNLMSPVIYSSSKALSTSQCQQMRQAALTVREAALRKS